MNGKQGALVGAAIAIALAAASCGRTHGTGPKSSGEVPVAGQAGAGTAGGADGTGGADGDDCAETAALAPARVWKLSNVQYVNAVQQTFGVEVELPDDLERAFDSDAIIGDSEVAQYQKAAKDVARSAVAAHFDTFLPCPEDACVQQFLKNRIARAFGRRLDDDEVERYSALYDRGAEQNPEHGIELVIEAALQSPAFLYRSELGPPTAGGPRGEVGLTSAEMAVLLAYTLSDSLPDDELWEKGDTNALTDPSEVAAQVERLLALPAAAVTLSRSASVWLELPRLRGALRDPEAFPDLPDAFMSELEESGRLFARDLVEGGEVDDLVSSNRLYLNADLARFYGLGGVGGLLPLEASASERQHGILSHPALLTALSSPSGTDPTSRGSFLSRALLCASEVGEVEALGLLSERYDAVGRYRETDEKGAIDDSVELTGWGDDIDGPTEGLAGLASKLRGSRRLSDCVVDNLAPLLLGRTKAQGEVWCALGDVKDTLHDRGKLVDLYRALLTSPHFATRKGD